MVRISRHPFYLDGSEDISKVRTNIMTKDSPIAQEMGKVLGTESRESWKKTKTYLEENQIRVSE